MYYIIYIYVHTILYYIHTKCARLALCHLLCWNIGVSKDIAPMAEEGQVKPEEDEEEDQDDSDEERDHNFAIEKLFKKEGYPPFSDPDQAETP